MDADTEAGLAREILERRSGSRPLTRVLAVITLVLFCIMILGVVWSKLSCIGCEAHNSPAVEAGPGSSAYRPGPTPTPSAANYDSNFNNVSVIVVALSAVGSFLSAIATASSVVLGWRKDRRETAEFRQRLLDLEARSPNV